MSKRDLQVKLRPDLARERYDDPDDTMLEPPESNPPLYASGEIHVLVLDDDELIGRMIEEALSTRGFHLNIVSDTRRIEEELRRRKYALILLDYVLPGLQTQHVLDWIHEYQADAAVIVVTAYPSIDSALNCLRARTFDYLTKPFQISHLQETVTRCLESKGLLRLSEEALRVSLGAAIRSRRKALNYTLADMAKRTKISLGYLSQIELGKNSASIELFYKISTALGLRMSELFEAVQSTW
jgi:CheY-like chemotaxis protein/DNA-binding XRE family transcriptional regulator